MFNKYYKSQYLKIKEYERISNISFEKFVFNIIRTESKNYPKRKKSTKWIMMLLSFCFGMFIIVEAWNLFLWFGRDILSIKALFILGIPSIFVSRILLRWIFSSDLTHIDLAKFHIVENNIPLAELYLNHIISNESIDKYSKNCTDDIVKILSKSTTENSEEDKSLNESLKEECDLNTKDSTDENIETNVESLDNVESTDDNDESANDESVDKDNVSEEKEEVNEEVSCEVSEETTEEVSEDTDVDTSDLKKENEIVYDKQTLSNKIKEVLIKSSLNNIDSAKILLKDIVAINSFEKSSPEETLNKSLKKSIYKEFRDFINDKSIIW